MFYYAISLNYFQQVPVGHNGKETKNVILRLRRENKITEEKRFKLHGESTTNLVNTHNCSEEMFSCELIFLFYFILFYFILFYFILFYYILDPSMLLLFRRRCV